jgi:hypothetical protein
MAVKQATPSISSIISRKQNKLSNKKKDKRIAQIIS